MTKKDVPRLISLRAEQSLKLVRRPKLYVGDFVRIAKIDIPFRKGYEQSFTDEVFEIFDIPTRNPPTYNLIDADRDPIEGKFYEPELIRVLEKEGSSYTMSNNFGGDKDSFSITLVSSASMNIFIENSLASFKNLLSEDIDL